MDALPDTGTLRSDILALFKPKSAKNFEISLKIMSGLVEMIAKHPDLAEAGHRATVEPWVHIHRALMKRAHERGEVKHLAQIDAVSEVIPFAVAYRTIILKQLLDLAVLTRLVDSIVLPALGLQDAARKPVK